MDLLEVNRHVPTTCSNCLWCFLPGFRRIGKFRSVKLPPGSNWKVILRFLQRYYSLLRPLRDRTVQATIQHGDFAPWNIKAGPDGHLTTSTRERGELRGVPGWDWFHYVIQSAILVARRAPEEIAQRIEKVFVFRGLPDLRKTSGITGIERELVIAYLSRT